MKFIRENGKNGSIELMNALREMAEGKDAEIIKDDYISVHFKTARRVAFSVQLRGIIIECKEIHMVNQGDEENREYTYLFLDKTSIDLKRVEIDFNKTMSVELIRI